MIKIGQVFNLAEMRHKVELAKQAGNGLLSASPIYRCSKCCDTGFLYEVKTCQQDYSIPYFSCDIPRPCKSCQSDPLFSKYCVIDGLNEDQKKRTFQTATIDDDNKAQFEKASQFVENIDHYFKKGRGVYIFADPHQAAEFGLSAYGVGKTYMMHCMANALYQRHIPALYIPEYKLFQDIKNSWDKYGDSKESKVLEGYYNAPVLLIDDLFSVQYKEWGEAILYSIIEDRSNNKKLTVITSNYSPDRIPHRLQINGGKIASRIKGQSELIMMIGKDRRIIEALHGQ